MTKRLAMITGLLAAIGLSGCETRPRITAGGATFVDPIMQCWAADYRREFGIEIDYVKKGSGYGIRQMTEKTLEFACTDTPMTRADLAIAAQLGGEVLHIPLTIGGIAVVYHLPEMHEPLRLSGDVLAEIYLRRITRWNHTAIQQLNPGARLPDEEIVPVTRAESSGTTQVFMEYLAAVHPDVPPEMVSKKPRWSAGVLGQEGSDGVTGHVKRHPYCIGYVEVLYARKNALSMAWLGNRAGEFTLPGSASLAAAAEHAARHKPQREPYSLHEGTLALSPADGPGVYPLAAVSYAILYRRQPAQRGETIVQFLRWVLGPGQQRAAEYHYAPLPEVVRRRGLEQLDRVVYE